MLLWWKKEHAELYLLLERTNNYDIVIPEELFKQGGRYIL